LIQGDRNYFRNIWTGGTGFPLVICTWYTCEQGSPGRTQKREQEITGTYYALATGIFIFTLKIACLSLSLSLSLSLCLTVWGSNPGPGAYHVHTLPLNHIPSPSFFCSLLLNPYRFTYTAHKPLVMPLSLSALRALLLPVCLVCAHHPSATTPMYTPSCYGERC
jgi:hypothetical protein